LEPIHQIGSIQPHGFLLALEKSDLTIQHSANTELLLGILPEELIAKKLEEIIGSARCRQISEAVRADNLKPICPLTINPKGRTSKQTFQATLHWSDQLLILEAEPFTDRDADRSNNLSYELASSFPSLFSACGIPDLLSGTAQEIQRLTDFDSVMIYQFDEDYVGTVIAEHSRDFMPSYLNQRFPASDIPRQARALYTKNRVRLLVNVDATSSPIVPQINKETKQPLDLSFSILRSMSEIHIEYLKNMGVTASMSISVMKDGKLWGLIACHHKVPKMVVYTTRVVLDLLAQLLSLLVARMEHAQYIEYRLSLKKAQDRISHNLSLAESLADALERSSADVLEVTGAKGFALFFEGNVTTAGVTPSPAVLHILHEWLNKTAGSNAVYTHKLSAICPSTISVSQIASGLIAVPISRSAGYWLVWFRPEIVQEISWAGNPEKPVHAVAASGRIHPRRSFKMWKEQVRGAAEPWKQSEIDSAQELGTRILDFVLEKIVRRKERDEEIHNQQVSFHQQREDWLAALAHDLQTPAIGMDRLLDLLIKGAAGSLPEPQLELLVTLKDSNSKQLERILKLLEVFRYETQTGTLKIKPIAVEPVVINCIEELASLASARNITVMTDCQAKSASAMASAEALHRLVLNILDNAINFSEEGATVEVGWKLVGGNVVLHVRDHGPGIPEEDQKYLFERFWQGGSPGKYHVSIGLGLYLCRQIVAALGGSIACSSKPGKGSTFKITLPAALATTV
jgi:two-component system, chemotaxis family, sensor kinase Cph1